MSSEETPAGTPAAPGLDESGRAPATAVAGEDLTPEVAATETDGQPTGIPLRLFALGVAVVGGLLGILGAVFEEVVAGSEFFVAAPVIEEAMKPAGIYILLIRWPLGLRGQIHTAALTAVSGLSFGVIESLIYVTVYFPDQGSEFVLFRFTVPVAMHAVASFVVGLGLSRALIDWAAGRGTLPKRTRNFYLAGVGLHAAYNTLVLALALTGVLEFEE
jgi:RsiW-degrading membrane proteinase PrsW (M82 family)